MDAMDDQPLHLQRDMTPSTHIEACMTMSVRRRSATRTALVTSALVRLTYAVFYISRDFPGILIVLIPFWSGMG